MIDAQIRKCHERLERFLVDLLEPVGRSERRHWGAVYVRGLLLDGERKSVEPMALRLPDGNVQAMQQFVGQSPWDWKPIGERLSRRMTAELEPEAAWVLEDTGFPKQGDRSVGVERQYSGTLGKTGNCQVAVSLHHVGAQGSAALNWRLYLPESWTGDSERRAEAGIPDQVEFKKKWQLALEMIDEVREWGLADRIVVADAGRLRRRDRVPGCFGNQAAFLCGGNLVTGGSLGQAAQDLHPRVQRSRSARYPVSIRETEAQFGAGCGAPRQRLEEDPLARRIKGLAGIAVPCRAGATLAWLRGWRGPP